MHSKEQFATTIWELLESLQWEKQMESALTACMLTVRKVIAVAVESLFALLINLLAFRTVKRLGTKDLK